MIDDGGRSDRALPFLSVEELDYWERMPGFLVHAAARRLHRAALEAPSGGAVVELGSFAGKSLVCLGRGAANRAREDALELVAVDVRFHDGWEAAIGYFGLREAVTRLEMGSISAADTWRRPISVLYIDADHGPAHARADFVAWEPFVVTGGVIALDDTVGFFPGCTLVVQMALAGGRYELMDDVGGVTFLRKCAPLFDGIGVAPLLRGSVFAELAATSAWTGAMDPSLRLPMPVSFTLSSDMIETRLDRADASLDDLRARLSPDLRGEVLPTVEYLGGIVQLHRQDYVAALAAFDGLVDESSPFFHYDLPIAPLAQLRRAQVLDLLGRRDEAVQEYERLATCDIDALCVVAASARMRPYEVPPPVPGRLLREYVLESPLHRYRLPRPRG